MRSSFLLFALLSLSCALRCEEKGTNDVQKARADPPVKEERGEWGLGKPEDWPLPIRLFLLLVLQLKNQTVK